MSFDGNRASTSVLADFNSFSERTIVYVGERQRFSDCLARMVASEIEGVNVSRSEGFPPFFTEPDGARRGVELVVVDERLIPELLDLVRQDRTLLERFTVAVGYRDAALLRDRLPELLGEGVRNVLPMDVGFDVWLSILRLMTNGGTYVPGDLVAGLRLEGLRLEAPANGAGVRGTVASALTQREREVLKLVADGTQTKHIATSLSLSEHTVKLNIHHIISKLGVHNRTQAAARYFECRSV